MHSLQWGGPDPCGRAWQRVVDHASQAVACGLLEGATDAASSPFSFP